MNMVWLSDEGLDTHVMDILPSARKIFLHEVRTGARNRQLFSLFWDLVFFRKHASDKFSSSTESTEEGQKIVRQIPETRW